VNKSNLNSVTRISIKETAQRNGQNTTYHEYGYKIIDGFLVPNAFMEELAFDLRDSVLFYDAVLSPQKLCSPDFLNSLSSDAKAALGACVLLLIKDGFVKIDYSGYPKC